MKFKISSQSIIRVLFLLSVCICILNIFKLYGVISFLYTLMFPLVILLTVLVLSTGYNRKFSIIFLVLISILALTNSSISLLLSSQGNTIADLKKTVIFITTIAFLFVANQVKLDKKTLICVEKAIIVSSVLIVLLYFLKYNEIYRQTNSGVRFLYFNFHNPNYTSMYLLVYGIYNLIFSWKFQKKIYKILCFCLALFMFFCVVKTLSRNTLLIMILFLVGYIFIRTKKQLGLSNNIPISILISVWPLVFAILYMSFVHVVDKVKILSFLNLEKGFDTRYEVWSNALAKLRESPIMGDFSFSVIRQSHNSHLDIWISYGLIVLLLTCVFIFLIVNNSGNMYANRISFLYMFGFICCIFIGMAEAALFSGCQGLFIMVGVLALLSKSESEYVTN